MNSKRNASGPLDFLLAHGNPLFDSAVVADYRAAPLETTLTPFGPFLTDHVVPSIANRSKSHKTKG